MDGYVALKKEGAARFKNSVLCHAYVRQDANVLSEGSPLGEEVEGTTLPIRAAIKYDVPR